MNQLGLMFQLLLSDHVQKHHIDHLMATLQLLRTIYLIIVSNHQVQIRKVLNHLVHIHLTMVDQYMITLYLIVDVEEAVDMEEAVDVEEAIDVDEAMDMDKAMDVDEVVDVGVLGHIVPHHQVVIHHTKDMPGTVGLGGHLLE